MPPKYAHNCDECIFVGHADGRDVYIHPYIGFGQAQPSSTTFLARSSDGGSDYQSTTPQHVAEFMQERFARGIAEMINPGWKEAK